MENMEHDPLVVGSGISGGWAAKELREKGLKVLLLERGQDVEHVNPGSFHGCIDYKAGEKAWAI